MVMTERQIIFMFILIFENALDSANNKCRLIILFRFKGRESSGGDGSGGRCSADRYEHGVGVNRFNCN